MVFWNGGKQLNHYWLLEILVGHNGTMDYLLVWINHKYFVVPQHCSPSFSNKLKDPPIVKLDFYFPKYGLGMSFKGP